MQLSEQTPLLRLDRIHKAFGSHVVLNGISLELARAEIVALVGQSGSGKSTVAKIVAGLESVNQGSLHFDGQPLGPRRSHTLRRRIQMVFQDPFGSLNPVHTILHHIARPLRLHKICSESDIRRTVSTLLETVGLTPAEDFIDSHPHRLSGGQKQRVAIARALAPEPNLILADEPTSMLDVSIRIDVLNLMNRLRETRGVSWLFITHDLASARYLADKTLVLDRGQVVESGPTHDVLTAPQHPYTQSLMTAASRHHTSLTNTVIQTPERPHV